MGAESSTLQSVHSLSESLNQIERKLQSIEHHQHRNHEISTSTDNIVVSDKIIFTLPYINFSIEPIIGLIGSRNVRIMLELNENSNITFNFFELDDFYDSKPRYLFDKNVVMKKSTPMTVQFDELTPNTSYVVIIGGVNCADALNNKLSFRTLPSDNDVKTSPRFLLTHGSRIDRSTPDEQSIWPHINDKLHRSNLPQNGSHVHMIIHNGNILSFEDQIRGQVTELLTWLMYEEATMDGLDHKLKRIEDIIYSCYRKSMRSSSMNNTRKQCGNIFIAGECEALSEMMASLIGDAASIRDSHLQKKSTAPSSSTSASTSDEHDSSAVHEANTEENKDAHDDMQLDALLSSNEMKTASHADQELIKHYVEEKMLRDKRSASLQQIISEDGNYEVSIMDKKRLLTSNEELKQHMNQDLQHDADSMMKHDVDVRLAVAGLVARIARRSYWTFMRALWDDNCSQLLVDDLMIEEKIQMIIILQSKMHVFRQLYHSLHKSKVKHATEFGASKASLREITNRRHMIIKDIRETEKRLIGAYSEYEMVVQHVISSQDDVTWKYADMDSFRLLIIDTAFDYISKNGEVRPDYRRYHTSLHPKIFESFDLTSSSAHHRPSDKMSSSIAKNVMIISSTPLLPNLKAFESYIATRTSKMIPLAIHDTMILIERLCRWQMQDRDRAVMIAMPTSTSICKQSPSSARMVPSYINKHNEDDFDMNRYDMKCSLSVILLDAAGDRSRVRGRHHMTIDDYQHVLQDQETSSIIDSINTFTAVLEVDDSNTSIYPGRSYWDVSFILSKPMISTAASISQHADVHMICCGPEYHGFREHVSLGPVIGDVSYNYAYAMVEFSCDGYVELVAVDQVTGMRYTSMQYVQPNHAMIFTFSSLQPGHAYDISINDHRYVSSFHYYVRGSFTTMSYHNNTVMAKEAKQIHDMISDLHHQLPAIESSTIVSSHQHQEIAPSVNRSSDHHPSTFSYIASRQGSQVLEKQSTISRMLLSQRKASTASSEDNRSVHKSSRSVFHRFSNPLHSISNHPRTSMRVPAVDMLSKSNLLANDVMIADDKNLIDAKPSTPVQGAIPAMLQPSSSTTTSSLSSNITIIAVGGDHRSIRLNDAKSRDHIMQGMELVRELATIAAEPLDGVDLILHIGSTIDISVIRDEMLSYAAQLDILYMNPRWTSEASDSIMDRICDCIKSCYRICWRSSSSYRSFLSHGSHMFIHDPMLDLFNIFEVGDYEGLQRDLNIRTISSIIHAMNMVYDENVQLLRHDTKNPCIRYLHNDEAVVYHLPLDLINSSSYDDLINPIQYQELNEYLHSLSSHKMTSTLLLTLALPLINPSIGDLIAAERSGIDTNTFYGGVCCSHRDITLILDLLYEQWLKLGRHAIIMCSGPEGCIINISSSLASSGSLRQICCGPLLGIGSSSYQPSWLQRPSTLEIKSSTMTYTCNITYNTSTQPHAVMIKTSVNKDSAPVGLILDHTSLLSTIKSKDRPFHIQHKKYSNMWNKIIRHINAVDSEMSINPDLDNDDANKLDKDAMQMLRAVDKIMNERYAAVFNDAFTRFKSMESFHQSNAEYMIPSIISFLWYQCRKQYLPAPIAELFPEPSTIATLNLWRLHIQIKGSTSDMLGDFNTIKQYKDVASDDGQNAIIAAMRCDCEYFVRFFRHVICGQLLSEYFSSKQ